jgi:protocatechuate 3,4-dioxygenase beta subunit
MTKFFASLFIIVLLSTCGNSQELKETEYKLVGGPCEGCEAVFEFGDKKLFPVDTLPDFSNVGPKLKLTGTIFKQDGSTPAKDVILYIYHTNQNGIYPTNGDETGWAKRHGYLRGWIKTDEDGKYTFFTLRPGVYPSRNAPAHIHATILEPNGKYYWIEEFLFDDDTLVSEEDKNKKSPRGGTTGVLSLKKDENVFVGERNIILGKNISDYD